MNLYLVMSLFWLLLGVGLILFFPEVSILNTDYSAGWLVLVLAFYNLFRWWSVRMYVKDRRHEEEAGRHYWRRHSHGSHADEGPNPAFDFSQKPLEKEGDDPKHGPTGGNA